MSGAGEDEVAALRARVAELEEELRVVNAANAVLTKKVRCELFSFCQLVLTCPRRVRIAQTAHMEKAFEDLMGKFGSKATADGATHGAQGAPLSARDKTVSPRTSQREWHSWRRSHVLR